MLIGSYASSSQQLLAAARSQPVLGTGAGNRIADTSASIALNTRDNRDTRGVRFDFSASVLTATATASALDDKKVAAPPPIPAGKGDEPQDRLGAPDDLAGPALTDAVLTDAVSQVAGTSGAVASRGVGAPAQVADRAVADAAANALADTQQSLANDRARAQALQALTTERRLNLADAQSPAQPAVNFTA